MHAADTAALRSRDADGPVRVGWISDAIVCTRTYTHAHARSTMHAGTHIPHSGMDEFGARPRGEGGEMGPDGARDNTRLVPPKPRCVCVWGGEGARESVCS